MYKHIIRLAQLFVKLSEDLQTLPDQQDQYSPNLSQLTLDPEALKILESKKFDYDTFSKLNSLESIMDYAENNLFYVSRGLGSSRAVFDIGDDKVLKIAANHAGIGQNNMEARIQDKNPLFTKIYDMHPRALWIIAEKVYPFDSYEDFEKHFGIPKTFWGYDRAYNIIKRPTPEKIQKLKKIFNLSDQAVDILINISKIIGLGVVSGDTYKANHWGINRFGDLKLLDFGLDSGLHKNFYEESGWLKQEETEVEKLANYFINKAMNNYI